MPEDDLSRKSAYDIFNDELVQPTHLTQFAKKNAQIGSMLSSFFKISKKRHLKTSSDNCFMLPNLPYVQDILFYLKV